MKLVIFIMISLTTFVPYLQAVQEIDNLVKNIKPIIQETSWALSTDIHSITLVCKKCQFLNLMSHPGGTDEEIWKKYSITAGYRISISFDSKLNDAEYQQLKEIKKRFIAERTKGETPGTKDYWGKSFMASRLIKLPQYKSDRYSIYVYSSQSDFYEVRPKIVQDQAEAIIQILEKQFESYEKRYPNDAD